MTQPPQPQEFTVHVFAVVRIKVPRVVAFHRREACCQAIDLLPDLYARFRSESPEQEFAEEFSHFLVDEADDPEYRNSRFIPSVQEDLIGLLQRLVDWYDAEQDADGLRSLIAKARETISEAI